LAETEKQKEALEQNLNKLENHNHYKCFIAMRYWHPFSHETVEQVKKYQPDKIILMPLYPHYSITTTGSSLIDWDRHAKKAGLEVPYAVVRDYPDLSGFIEGHVDMIQKVLDKVENLQNYRILYSAHGLPEKIIESGDPYRERIELSCRAIQEKLGHPDHSLCFQGQVGPMKWIEPFIDDEIKRAGKDGKSVIVVPISFVSEHSETLVELDVDYHELYKQENVKDYIRISAMGCHPHYIEALSQMVIEKTEEMQRT
jgi:ferrochelatase